MRVAVARRVVASAVGFVVAVGLSVTGGEPAGAVDAPPVLEPELVLADGTSASDGNLSVDAITSSAAVIRRQPTYGSSVEASPELYWADGAHRRMLASTFGADFLTENWLLRYAADENDQIGIESFDGSTTGTRALAAAARLATPTQDGWLEVAPTVDGAQVRVTRVVIGAGASITATDLGIAYQAPSGQIIADVYVSGATSLDWSTAGLDLSMLDVSGTPMATAVSAVDLRTGAITAVGSWESYTGPVISSVGSGSLLLEQWDFDSSVLTRWTPEGSTSWTVPTDNGWLMSSADVGGDLVVVVADYETGATTIFRGEPDGSLTAIDAPWWADMEVLGNSDVVLYSDGVSVHRASLGGIVEATLVPPAKRALAVTSLAIDGAMVAWADDSASEVDETTVWTRMLGSVSAASAVVSRATGRSIAYVNGQLYALQVAGAEFSLVRGGPTVTAVVPGALRVARDVDLQSDGNRLLAANLLGLDDQFQWHDAIVDVTTAAVTDAVGTLAVGGGWVVTVQNRNEANAALVATNGSTTRSFPVGGLYLDQARVVDGTLVWLTYTDVLGQYVLYEADLATGAVHEVQVGENATYIAGAGSGRVAIGFGETAEMIVDVFEIGASTPAFRLDAAAEASRYSETSVALGPTWVAWVTDGPEGNRAVAARIPGAPLFTDVPVGAPFVSEISWLVDRGVTGGYADGGFHPSAAVSRQAMAAFLYRYAGSPAFTAPAVSPFSDVATDAGFYKEICWLADAGITGGYADGGFHPTAPVSRQAMAAFLYRFAGEPAFSPPASSPFTDLATDSAFYPPVTWLADAGITGGYADGGFHPSAAVSRQAMAAFLYRYDTNVNGA